MAFCCAAIQAARNASAQRGGQKAAAATTSHGMSLEVSVEILAMDDISIIIIKQDAFRSWKYPVIPQFHQVYYRLAGEAGTIYGFPYMYRIPLYLAVIALVVWEDFPYEVVCNHVLKYW